VAVGAARLDLSRAVRRFGFAGALLRVEVVAVYRSGS
jgi:hypothetical protein